MNDQIKLIRNEVAFRKQVKYLEKPILIFARNETVDYIIDMGPEGGELGGMVMASGTPEQVVEVKDSYTGQYLKNYLA